MSLIEKSALARDEQPTDTSLSKGVRDYVQSVTELNLELCRENARLKRRVSNQRRELRRLCHAQYLLRFGMTLSKFLLPNAVRQSQDETK